MIVPCKDCDSREIGCHAKCEKYLAFAEERESVRKKNHEEVMKNVYSKSYLKNIAYYSEKRQHKRRV